MTVGFCLTENITCGFKRIRLNVGCCKMLRVGVIRWHYWRLTTPLRWLNYVLEFVCLLFHSPLFILNLLELFCYRCVKLKLLQSKRFRRISLEGSKLCDRYNLVWFKWLQDRHVEVECANGITYLSQCPMSHGHRRNIRILSQQCLYWEVYEK